MKKQSVKYDVNVLEKLLTRYDDEEYKSLVKEAASLVQSNKVSADEMIQTIDNIIDDEKQREGASK